MFWRCLLLGLSMGASALFAQSAARLNLGRLQTGAAVSFTRSTSGWGVEISGGAAPCIRQLEPAKLEIYRADENIRQVSAGYKTVQKTAAGMDARAEIAYGQGVVFHVNDRWNLSGPVLSMRRTVTVTGTAPGGFCSSVIASGVAHSDQVSLSFGQNESFRDVTRDAWRWAWNTLKPQVNYIDVAQMRRVLLDHLEAQARSIDGRTAIPFVLNTMSDELQWNWSMVAMGFVGKNIECADELLREGDRDPTERGQKMRQTGLAIIASLIQALPTVPLQGTGYDLKTGKPWDPEHDWQAPWLRNATEDMRVLMRAWGRERAKAAADFAESWIWIWNVPMPPDADDPRLHYKKGVPTVGVQGITAAVSGGVDEYLDWAVPSYAKLYNLTKDEHYLDVACVLLHDTKSMVALPGRQYDVKSIGWQQEGWRMGPGSSRGVGGHRFWLPWVSANHLYGITGLEEYDPALFKKLSTKPAAAANMPAVNK